KWFDWSLQESSFVFPGEIILRSRKSQLSHVRASVRKDRHDGLFRLDISGKRAHVNAERRTAHCASIEPCHAVLSRCYGNAVFGEPCLRRQSKPDRKGISRRF